MAVHTNPDKSHIGDDNTAGSASDQRPDGGGHAASPTACVVSPRKERHFLNSRWCLLISLPDSSPHKGGGAGASPSAGDWKDRQRVVYEFDTVEDFWCMYNSIHPPSCVPHGGYSLFKAGILPAWEDEKVKNGGRFTASFANNIAQPLRIIDAVWLHVCMAMVGEQLDASLASGVICGAVVKSRRNRLRLELWIGSDSDRCIEEVGNRFEGVMSSVVNSPRDFTCSFESFRSKAYD